MIIYVYKNNNNNNIIFLSILQKINSLIKMTHVNGTVRAALLTSDPSKVSLTIVQFWFAFIRGKIMNITIPTRDCYSVGCRVLITQDRDDQRRCRWNPPAIVIIAVN